MKEIKITEIENIRIGSAENKEAAEKVEAEIRKSAEENLK